jgi:hypothetical protein
MSENKEFEVLQGAVIPQSGTCAKKPYTKPAFYHERVFETTALRCGKVETTQHSCRYNRKTS